MSVKAMTWASSKKAGSSTAKLVLVMLADFAGDDGESHYSNARLAETCEMSVDTLQRHLAMLESLGLIARIATYRPDGSRSTNKIFCLYSVEARAEAIRLGWKEISEIPGIEPPANCGPPAANSGGPHRTGAGTPPQLCGGHKEPTKNRKDSLPLTPKTASEGREGLSGDVEGSKPVDRSDGFERFEAAWMPWTQLDTREAALVAWRRLKPHEREDAARNAAVFVVGQSALRHPKWACTYLAQRLWRYPLSRGGSATVTQPTAPTEARKGVHQQPDGSWWLAPDSPQLQRWREFERATSIDRRAKRGCIRPSEWPPSRPATQGRPIEVSTRRHDGGSFPADPPIRANGVRGFPRDTWFGKG